MLNRKEKYFSIWTCSIFIVVGFFIGVNIDSNFYRHGVFSTGGPTILDDQNRSNENSLRCSWQFKKYVPSAWEMEWFSKVETYQYKVCPILHQDDQLNRSIDVLRRIISLQQVRFEPTSQILSIDEHFSQMHYVGMCGKQHYKVVHRIEPLIGLVRDPLTMCPEDPKIPRDLRLDGEAALQSKRFLLLGPSSPYQLDPFARIPSIAPWLSKPSGKKILIDIGSSYFNSRNGNTAEVGSRWFYEYFKNKSIQFDRIIAYENQPLSARRVWEELPDDVLPFYTMINVGVDANGNSRFNPWRMIESVAQMDDYVLVKLDIDTPTIETPLMKQLTETKNIRVQKLIDEIFFEKHVSADPNSSDEKLKDTYILFTQLRRSGIRMHGWP